MSEFIKREAVMKAFADFVWNSNHSDLVPAPTWNQAVDIVRDFPAANVAPERHAHWIRHGKPNERLQQYEVVFWSCSRCGQVERNMTPYCCNCGAKMDGGADK